MKTLVVFSHLRWNFVYQRPQHLLTRLAAQRRVVFIEEPVPGSEKNYLERIKGSRGVEVWRPHLCGPLSGFHPENCTVLQALVGEALDDADIKDYFIWYYTPMALPVAANLEPAGVIFDCMDELSAFKNAPPELLQQEAELFRQADVVFTGGRSLYNAKRSRHSNIHCFPSSVDAVHFRQTAADHPLQAEFPRPRLGYCGVIDERIDMSLIAGMAAAHPEWQLVMVGPVVKIDPASLPRAPNIHWMGQQSYADLPAFISGWDVCLMPFAINESTKFISPTKMLEYMACGRPSISTAIRDVVEPYGDLIRIAHDAAGFVAAAEELLARSPDEQKAHAGELAEAIQRTSWDDTAERMSFLIQECELKISQMGGSVERHAGLSWASGNSAIAFAK
jgi:glycosyltransferase involved in cell wall biosynthesis